MLLEKETFEKYGYYPKELSFSSHKKVIIKCDFCNKICNIINRNISGINFNTKHTCGIKDCINKKRSETHLNNKLNKINLNNKIHIGDKHGNWIILDKPFIRRNKNNKHMGFYVKCRCICGKEKNIIIKNNLIKTISCGCNGNILKRKLRTEYPRLYDIYRNMLSRCYNKNLKNYSIYGARGIKICDEWLKGFEYFGEWALKHGYNNQLVIDRINPNKNYCPENCQWVTKSENSKRISRAREEIIKQQEIKINYLLNLINGNLNNIEYII